MGSFNQFFVLLIIYITFLYILNAQKNRFIPVISRMKRSYIIFSLCYYDHDNYAALHLTRDTFHTYSLIIRRTYSVSRQTHLKCHYTLYLLTTLFWHMLASLRMLHFYYMIRLLPYYSSSMIILRFLQVLKLLVIRQDSVVPTFFLVIRQCIP